MIEIHIHKMIEWNNNAVFRVVHDPSRFRDSKKNAVNENQIVGWVASHRPITNNLNFTIITNLFLSSCPSFPSCLRDSNTKSNSLPKMGRDWVGSIGSFSSLQPNLIPLP